MQVAVEAGAADEDVDAHSTWRASRSRGPTSADDGTGDMPARRFKKDSRSSIYRVVLYLGRKTDSINDAARARNCHWTAQTAGILPRMKRRSRPSETRRQGRVGKGCAAGGRNGGGGGGEDEGGDGNEMRDSRDGVSSE